MKTLSVNIITLFFLLYPAHTCQNDNNENDPQLLAATLKNHPCLTCIMDNRGDFTSYPLATSKIQVNFNNNTTGNPEKNKTAVSTKEQNIDDPNYSRLYFAPTARPLEAWNGYLAVNEVILPTVNIGLTDFLSIGGGLTIFPEPMYYYSLKLSPYHSDNLAVSIGYFNGGQFNDNNSYPSNLSDVASDVKSGIVYGCTTYGNVDNSLTIGAGKGEISGDFDSSYLVFFGGELRYSNTVKFISENWIFPEESVFSLGVRVFGNYLTGDLGIFTRTDPDTFPVLPWLGIAYNW